MATYDPTKIHERRLTVSYLYPTPKSKRSVPWIRLCGDWLKSAGFDIQSKISVRVTERCLIITRV